MNREQWKIQWRYLRLRWRRGDSAKGLDSKVITCGSARLSTFDVLEWRSEWRELYENPCAYYWEDAPCSYTEFINRNK